MKIITDQFTQYGNYIYHNSYSPLRVLSGEIRKKVILPKEERTEEEKNLSKKISLARSKSTLKKLVLCNLPYGQPKFLTLTYRNPQFNETEAKRDFKNFIKRLKYHTKVQLRYIAVPEEHNSSLTRPDRLHSYHFHILIFDLSYIPASVYSDVWSHGFIRINRIDLNYMRVATYISKYISKQSSLPVSSRRFLTSRNIYRPREVNIYDLPLLEYESSRRYNRFTGGVVRCDIYKIVN